MIPFRWTNTQEILFKKSPMKRPYWYKHLVGVRGGK